MPLSDHEQRLLDQIERALYAEDPKFASAVRSTDPKVHYKRRIWKAAIGFVLGLFVVMAGPDPEHHADQHRDQRGRLPPHGVLLRLGPDELEAHDRRRRGARAQEARPSKPARASKPVSWSGSRSAGAAATKAPDPRPDAVPTGYRTGRGTDLTWAWPTPDERPSAVPHGPFASEGTRPGPSAGVGSRRSVRARSPAHAGTSREIRHSPSHRRRPCHPRCRATCAAGGATWPHPATRTRPEPGCPRAAASSAPTAGTPGRATGRAGPPVP